MIYRLVTGFARAVLLNQTGKSFLRRRRRMNMPELKIILWKIVAAKALIVKVELMRLLMRRLTRFGLSIRMSLKKS
jgi:hypothetical protein